MLETGGTNTQIRTQPWIKHGMNNNKSVISLYSNSLALYNTWTGLL